MSTTIIEAKGLVKRYGSAIAVGGVDLAVEAGEVVGLLGRTVRARRPLS